MDQMKQNATKAPSRALVPARVKNERNPRMEINYTLHCREQPGVTQPQQNSPEQSTSAKHEGAGAKWQTIKTPHGCISSVVFLKTMVNTGKLRKRSTQTPHPTRDLPSSLQAAAHSRTPGNPSSLGLLMENPCCLRWSR